MLGRWQPWHDGHQARLKDGCKNWSGGNTGSRCSGASSGDGQDDNPFDWDGL